MKLPRNAHLWLPGLLAIAARETGDVRDEPIDVLFCIADHFEPAHGTPGLDIERARVDAWVDRLPRLAARFRDADGRPPRHTFFFPAEQYRPEHLDALWRLCEAGLAEVEIHLHHDHDTSDGLRTRCSISHAAVARPWPADDYARWRGRVRLHPRELGARQRAARRPLLRCERRAHGPARDRVLRRLHAAGGPGRRRRREPSIRCTTRSTIPIGRDRTTAASTRASDASPPRRRPAARPGTDRAGLGRGGSACVPGLDVGAIDGSSATRPRFDDFAAGWMRVLPCVVGPSGSS